MEREPAPNRTDYPHTRRALQLAQKVNEAWGHPKITERIVIGLENRLRRLRTPPRAR